MSDRKNLDELLKGCVANNRQQQQALYTRFYAPMLRVCYRYLQTDMLAEEAVNSGFLKVFAHIREFDPLKGDLAAWIKTIMVRNSIDLLRREAKFIRKADADDLEEVFIDPTVLSKLYAEDLLKQVRALPAATRLVFNLSVVEGYTHREICEQLGITESTSRWHLSEAKKQLRAWLAADREKPADNQEERSA